MNHPSLALAGALALCAGDAGAAQEAPPELLDHQALEAALDELAAQHPGLVELLPVGESRQGRAIRALRLAAGEGAPGRPAILLVANVDAAHVYTSAMALHHARALAAGYGQDERATALLDSTTLYVIPRADPDGAEARFATPQHVSSGTGMGVDDDRDGRFGEDPPSDVDGDGYISVMRVLDPEGTWVEDPTDPRVLIEAKRAEGQRGRWKLWREGRDLDRDESIAEDPEHDAVVNRNFAHAWEAHAPAAGRYPTDEPEARALCELLLTHPDIALVLTYGAQGNLAGEPAVAKPGRRGDEVLGFLEDDAKVLEVLGERYREATGDEAEGEGQQGGSFQAWCYHHRGLWTLDVAPWSVPQEVPQEEDDAAEAEEAAAPPAEDAEKPPEPSQEAKQLRWLEAHGVTDAHLGWTAFEHPELGAVEIGGFAPYALIEPPPAQLAELTGAHYAHLLTLGELLPRVRLVELAAKQLGAGLVELTGALENEALLPYPSAAAREARSARPLCVRLELPAGATLLAGEQQVLVRELEGAGGRHELRWLVRTDEPGALRVTLDSDQAGSAAASPEVKS